MTPPIDTERHLDGLAMCPMSLSIHSFLLLQYYLLNGISDFDDLAFYFVHFCWEIESS